MADQAETTITLLEHVAALKDDLATQLALSIAVEEIKRLRALTDYSKDDAEYWQAGKRPDVSGPYIVWYDFGYGWLSMNFKSVTEAIKSIKEAASAQKWVLTRQMERYPAERKQP